MTEEIRPNKWATTVHQLLSTEGRVDPEAKAKVDSLEEYVKLLVSWNEKVNLVSRKDTENIWPSHILHSVSPLFLLNFPGSIRVLDIGTGGGLPGIPIGILRNDMRVVLLDSIRKKTAAIQNIVDSLSLKNIEVITGRAEDLSRTPGLAKAFDVVVARGVAELGTLWRWAHPFLKKIASSSGSGEAARLVSFKGGDMTEELGNAIKETGGKVNFSEIRIGGFGFDHLTDKKLIICSSR